MLSDLDYVIGVETDQHNLPFITPWERTQHEGAVRFPDFRHFIIEAGAVNPEGLLTHRMGLADVRDALDLMSRGEALKVLIQP